MENELLEDIEDVSKGINTPIYKEFHKIDMETGERLDVLLIDIANNVVPTDCREGWGEGFSNPVWSFENECWIEGDDIDSIIPAYVNQKIDELNYECQQAIRRGFEHNGDYFQFNETDQANFNQQLSLLLLDSETDSVIWKTENNGIKVFTREQFIAICKSSEIHKRTCITRYWTLKAFLSSESFSSIEEVKSIVF